MRRFWRRFGATDRCDASCDNLERPGFVDVAVKPVMRGGESGGVVVVRWLGNRQGSVGALVPQIQRTANFDAISGNSFSHYIGKTFTFKVIEYRTQTGR